MVNKTQYLPKVITVDGPSGAGKSVLCKAIAKKLQWHFLDSGVIYRSLALAALRYHIDLTSEKALASLAKCLDIRFISDSIRNTVDSTILFEGKVINNKICTQEVAKVASQIAVLPLVRKELLQRQRVFRINPGLVAGGRDMGTTVFNDAEVKFFLYASLESRVFRRMLQMRKRGFNVNFRCLLSEVKERDNRDRNRSVSPLIPDKDAFLLDSTSLTIEQLTEKALQYVRKKLMMYNERYDICCTMD